MLDDDRVIVEYCKSCGADVVWLRKPRNDGLMIVNVSRRSIEAKMRDERYDPATMTAHHATCPDAERWSRSAGAKLPDGSVSQPKRKQALRAKDLTDEYIDSLVDGNR